MYMYLISGENGWLRLGGRCPVLDVITEMHGVLSTLHNVAGAMYVAGGDARRLHQARQLSSRNRSARSRLPNPRH